MLNLTTKPPKTGLPTIKVCFAPKFSNTNPYQDSLAENLEELGVELSGVEDYRSYMPTEIKKRKAQLLHLHWLHRFYHQSKDQVSVRVFIKFVIGLWSLKLRGIPIVWTAHNIKSHEDTNEILDRLCNLLVVKQSDAIIAHSQCAKQEIIDLYKIKQPEKISVIPHANYIGQYKNELSQQGARERLNIPEAKTVFLFFGIIRAYKGLPELVEAFENIGHRDACLLIVGQPRDENLDTLLTQKANENPAIHFIPSFIAEDEVQLYMKAADVVVFPYRKLLTSGAILLAMSFGRACIAPQKGYISEVLDCDGAFLYSPDAEDGLLQAMRCAITRKTHLEPMGNHNYESTRTWGWPEVAAHTRAVYLQCLASAP